MGFEGSFMVSIALLEVHCAVMRSEDAEEKTSQGTPNPWGTVPPDRMRWQGVGVGLGDSAGQTH